MAAGPRRSRTSLSHVRTLVISTLLGLSVIGCQRTQPVVTISEHGGPDRSGSAGEPTWQGKSLSTWLLEGGGAGELAVRHIGTNALPTLLSMLGAKDRTVRAVVAKLQNEQLQLYYSSNDKSAEDLRIWAVEGFKALGTNAEPAVPQLTKLMRDEETRFQAMRALTKVGPIGFAVLTNALTSKEDAFRNNLIFVLGEDSATNPKAITGIMIRFLDDRDPGTRGNAADFLAGKDPELAVPALMKVLDDTEYYPRARAAIALGSYGPAAKSAYPKLMSVYTNVVAGRDKVLAQNLGPTLYDALDRIDPAATQKLQLSK